MFLNADENVLFTFGLILNEKQSFSLFLQYARHINVRPRNTNKTGRLVTLNLLIEVAYFVNKVNVCNTKSS